MPLVLNKSGLEFAHALLRRGAVDYSPFEFTAADGNKILGPRRNNWDRYKRYFFAQDEKEKPDTKGRYHHPVIKIKGGKPKLFYRAVLGLRDSASVRKYPQVYAEAKTLLEEIHKAGLSAKRRTVALAGISSAGLTVDLANGVIANAAIMTIGEPQGHDFLVDQKTLETMMACLSSAPARCRFGHPPAGPDGYPVDQPGTLIGEVNNFRIEGATLRGDVRLGPYAKSMPGLGDVWTYVINVATASPENLGLSAVIGFEPEPILKNGQPVGVAARVFSVNAIDIVGQPAANPNGLLSAGARAPAASTPAAPSGPTKEVHVMDPKLKGLLVSDYGLPSTASDQQAQSFFDALDPEKQEEVNTKVEAMGEPSTLATDAAEDAADGPEDDDDEDGEGGDPDEEGDADESEPGSPKAAAVKIKKLAALLNKATALAAKTPAARKRAAELAAQASVVLRPRRKLSVLAAETRRAETIRALARVLKAPPEAAEQQVALGATTKEARMALLNALKNSHRPLNPVSVGHDQTVDMLAAVIPQAVQLRAGVRLEKPHEIALKWRHLSVVDLARRYLAQAGVRDADTMSREKIIAMAVGQKYRGRFAMLAESIGDFPSLLLDAINKTLRQAYLDAKPTWTEFARRNTAPDFKNIHRVLLSESPSLVSRAQGGEVTFQNMTDGGETYQLGEYVGGIKLTRQAIINDDLDAFGRIPLLQGNACSRLEEDLTYAVLTGNPAMADGNAIFSAAHLNITAAGSGGPPSIAQVNDGFVAW